MGKRYQKLAKLISKVGSGSPDPQGQVGFHDASGSYAFHPNDNQNYLYVRSRIDGRDTVIEALNAGVPVLPDFPVTLRRVNREYVATSDYSRLKDYFEDMGVPYNLVGPHSHEPGGGLFDFVSSIRLRPALIIVKSGLIVTILKTFYVDLVGNLQFFDDQDLDLSIYLPPTTNKLWWILISIDRSDGSINVQTTPEKSSFSISQQDILGIDLTGIYPLMAIKMANGATTPSFYDMIDIRLWLGTDDISGITLSDGTTTASQVRTILADGQYFEVDDLGDHEASVTFVGTADDIEVSPGVSIGEVLADHETRLDMIEADDGEQYYNQFTWGLEGGALTFYTDEDGNPIFMQLRTEQP